VLQVTVDELRAENVQLRTQLDSDCQEANSSKARLNASISEQETILDVKMKPLNQRNHDLQQQIERFNTERRNMSDELQFALAEIVRVQQDSANMRFQKCSLETVIEKLETDKIKLYAEAELNKAFKDQAQILF